MPPAAPPERKTATDYHYHVFDYKQSVPFKPSPAQPARGKEAFYSLYRDLMGLRDYGASTGVPGIQLTAPGKVLGRSNVPGVAQATTMVLSFGRAAAKEGPEVLITGGIHASEWIGAEVAYLIAEYLIRNYSTKPSAPHQARLCELVNSRRIHVAPLLNPVGNDYSAFDQDGRLWRKNRRPLPTKPGGWLAVLTSRQGADRVPNHPFADVQPTLDTSHLQYSVPTYDPKGWTQITPSGYMPRLLVNDATGVDPNRNFRTIRWGYDTKDKQNSYMNQWDASGHGYFGPGSLSEDESRNIAEFVLGLPGRLVAIDYHSYGRFVLYPGEYHDAGRVDTAYERLAEVLTLLTATTASTAYSLGTPLSKIDYSVTGTITDYLAQFRAARALAIELDGNSFSLPSTEIQKVFETNIRGVLAAMAAGHGTTEDMAGAFLEFNKWTVVGRGNRLPG
jgi:hypothetical protein